jgi:integrase
VKIIPSGIPNLVKDGETGIFYARVKVGGLNKYRSLDTTKVTNAKLRLSDKLKEIREEAPDEKPARGLEVRSTFLDAAMVYESDVKADPRLEPSTAEVRVRPLATLRRTWPDVFKMEMRRITAGMIEAYMADFERGKWPYLPPKAKAKTLRGNSPSTVNKLIACLRNVFDVAVKAHVIAKNPAGGLTYKPVKKKLLQLPNRSQFAALVHHIRTKAGKGRIAADLVEGLAYSGLRLEEAGGLVWQDLDHERGMVTVHGTKTEGSARQIPMTDAFSRHINRMKEHREMLLGRTVLPVERVFEAGEASTSLANACKAVGVKKLTHHDLRHLFATTCIESGVDVPTVAGWLGHSDGGTLAMQTYGHIRPAHSKEAVKKVQF